MSMLGTRWRKHEKKVAGLISGLFQPKQGCCGSGARSGSEGSAKPQDSNKVSDNTPQDIPFGSLKEYLPEGCSKNCTLP